MLAFDWLDQTDKIGCNIFPARMTCAELWCQISIVWEPFHKFVSNFTLEGTKLEERIIKRVLIQHSNQQA